MSSTAQQPGQAGRGAAYESTLAVTGSGCHRAVGRRRPKVNTIALVIHQTTGDDQPADQPFGTANQRPDRESRGVNADA